MFSIIIIEKLSREEKNKKKMIIIFWLTMYRTRCYHRKFSDKYVLCRRKHFHLLFNYTITGHKTSSSSNAVAISSLLTISLDALSSIKLNEENSCGWGFDRTCRDRELGVDENNSYFCWFQSILENEKVHCIIHCFICVIKSVAKHRRVENCVFLAFFQRSQILWSISFALKRRNVHIYMYL